MSIMSYVTYAASFTTKCYKVGIYFYEQDYYADDLECALLFNWVVQGWTFKGKHITTPDSLITAGS